jgi:MinD superfamily P-loop ATPase
MAKRFSLPVKVVLNKADLSSRGADVIRLMCEQEGIELIASIPFDPALAAVSGQLADGQDPAAALPKGSVGAMAIDTIWAEVSSAVVI